MKRQGGSSIGSSVLMWIVLLACAGDLEVGERRYREGDRLAAMETWRNIPLDDSDYAEARMRITEVEAEFQQLVVRYKQRGRYFESRGRLAESVLNYRLALKLRPGDDATLALVQRLSRTLDTAKRETLAIFRASLEKRTLGAARQKLAELRALDPFDPELETEGLRFQQVLAVEVDQLMKAGQGEFSRGDPGSARKAFERVLELDPTNESAQGYLSYLSGVRAAGGAAALSRIQPLPLPASHEEIRAEGFYRNALAAEQAGDPFAAIRLDRSALEAYSDHAGARQHLASLRLKLETQVAPLIEAGREYYLREDLQSALDQWQRALLIEPGNARAAEYLERAQRILQNLERLRSDPQAGAR